VQPSQRRATTTYNNNNNAEIRQQREATTTLLVSLPADDDGRLQQPVGCPVLRTRRYGRFRSVHPVSSAVRRRPACPLQRLAQLPVRVGPSGADARPPRTAVLLAIHSRFGRRSPVRLRVRRHRRVRAPARRSEPVGVLPVGRRSGRRVQRGGCVGGERRIVRASVATPLAASASAAAGVRSASGQFRRGGSSPSRIAPAAVRPADGSRCRRRDASTAPVGTDQFKVRRRGSAVLPQRRRHRLQRT